MLHRSCSCPGGQKKTPVPRDRQTTLSQTPICRTHPASPPLRPYRWMTLRPAGVSCAKGAPCTPALGPEPQRKSGTVHRGNPALPGVPAQAGTICPRPVTQKQNCQGGFPLTWCTPPPCHADQIWDRRQIHHCWSLEMMEEAWYYWTVVLCENEPIRGKNEPIFNNNRNSLW